MTAKNDKRSGKTGGRAEVRTRLGKPRRRAMPLWRRRTVRMGAVAAVLAVLAGTGWWAWHSGAVARVAAKAHGQAVAWSEDAGLEVAEILVVGRKQTAQAALRDALGLERGAPILTFDVAAAKARIETLPWVRHAAVERVLPDTVLVTVEERSPMAIWQHDGAFALIDERGEVILRDGLERFSDLLLVVGEDAPAHTAALIGTLSAEPALMERVKAAVRVSGRRWDLHLDDGIDVRLPETGADDAWLRLAEYERSHGVLGRNVQVLDLRLPDRLIVREAQPGLALDGEGQET